MKQNEVTTNLVFSRQKMAMTTLPLMQFWLPTFQQQKMCKRSVR